MHWRRPSRAWCALTAAGFAAAVALDIPVDRRMTVEPVDGQRLAGQFSGGSDGGPGPRTSQKIEKTADGRRASYEFQNFTGDKLAASFSISEKEFAAYSASFGYTQEGLDALKAWKKKAAQDALNAAVQKRQSQAQLDRAVADIEALYKTKLKDYLSDRGFVLEPGNVVEVDMPGLVRKNAPLIKPLAETFSRAAKDHRYSSAEIVGAVLSMAQTAMFYKEPDDVIDGVHNGGLLPPLTSVSYGWGDCDTKTGVVASVLANWPESKMVGVSVPGHYLMGILQVPEKGDMMLEFQGLQYVLLEPAGPAWLPPGHVGEQTSALLAGREGYRIQPFF